MISVTDFQMGRERNYQENVANYQLNSKYRNRKGEEEQKNDLWGKYGENDNKWI